MAPTKIIPWERAITLFVLAKVDILEEYEDEIRSPSLVLRMPAVVRLRRGGPFRKEAVRFSRAHVYARDGFRCQYCGTRRPTRELNYDHVLPRARGGRTNWENIVTSCYACNDRKGSRTPEEAGMALLRKPFAPKSLPMTLTTHAPDSGVPPIWAPYCGAASAGVERRCA